VRVPKFREASVDVFTVKFKEATASAPAARSYGGRQEDRRSIRSKSIVRDRMNGWRMKVTANCVAQGHSVEQGCPTCFGEGLQPLPWVVSRVARAVVAISGNSYPTAMLPNIYGTDNLQMWLWVGRPWFGRHKLERWRRRRR
jgi:hypothetical protein